VFLASSSEWRVPALLAVLILELLRGRVEGRMKALIGRCFVIGFGEVGGEIGEAIVTAAMFATKRGAGGSGGQTARAPWVLKRDAIFAKVLCRKPLD
jgi:hypothetical protein